MNSGNTQLSNLVPDKYHVELPPSLCKMGNDIALWVAETRKRYRPQALGGLREELYKAQTLLLVLGLDNNPGQ